MECESTQCAPNSGGNGTWTFHGKQGNATWRSGARATLSVDRYDAHQIVITRTDLPGTATPGLTAVYTGAIHGSRIDGTVVWTWPGHWNNRPASGQWTATVGSVVPGKSTAPSPRGPVAPSAVASREAAITIPKATPDCDPQNPPPVSGKEALAHTFATDKSRNYPASYCWCYIAAMRGNAEAENLYAGMLYAGTGVTKNLELSFMWRSKSAALGWVDAEGFLAQSYYTGTGTTKDLSAAFRWYKKAAEDGDAVSQENLAGMYALGAGTPKDVVQAHSWRLKAGAQGLPDAELDLIDDFQLGHGTPIDLVKAAYWKQKAMKDPQAAQMIKEKEQNEAKLAKEKKDMEAYKASKAEEDMEIKQYGWFGAAMRENAKDNAKAAEEEAKKTPEERKKERGQKAEKAQKDHILWYENNCERSRLDRASGEWEPVGATREECELALKEIKDPSLGWDFGIGSLLNIFSD